jgi:hypothetical protein
LRIAGKLLSNSKIKHEKSGEEEEEEDKNRLRL